MLGNDPTQTEIFDISHVHLTPEQHSASNYEREQAAIIQHCKFIEAHNVNDEITEREREGFEFAADWIVDLQHEFDLTVHRPDLDRDVIFIDKMDWRHLTGLPNTLAFYTNDYKKIFFKKDPEVPDYFNSGLVFHELIHKYLDRWVNIRSLIPHDNETALLYRRSGLQRGEIDAHLLQSALLPGLTLNELGTFAMQREFMQKLLNSWEYMDERQARANYLKKQKNFEQDGTLAVSFKTDSGGIIFNYYSKENLHYSRNGKLYLNDMTTHFQLAEELSGYFPSESKGSELSFADLCIGSKIYPAMQNQLRKVLDANLGAGFYARLKRAHSAIDSAALLAEVQHIKRIGIKPQKFNPLIKLKPEDHDMISRRN